MGQHSQTHKTLSNHPLNKEKTIQNESSTKMLQNTSLSSINKSDTKEKMTLKETEDKVVSKEKEIFAKKDDGNKSTCDIPQTIECDEAKINISQEATVGDTESVQEKKEEMGHNAL